MLPKLRDTPAFGCQIGYSETSEGPARVRVQDVGAAPIR